MTRKKRQKIVVGVTGGIGSGKSTACAVFERNGIPVFYADAIAKKLSVEDPTLRAQIRALLGDEAYDTEGNLNRSFIAGKLFSNAALRKKYEALLHPCVKEEIEKNIAALDSSSIPFVVVEAALLFEAGWRKYCDVVIVIEAPEDVCLERVRQRDGVTPEEVRARMKAQMKTTTKALLADYVVYNTGSLEELERNIQFLYQLIVTMKGEKKSD